MASSARSPSASMSASMTSTGSSSFVIASSAASENDDVASISSSILDHSDDDEYKSDAQKEWEASLEQLQLLLSMTVMPFLGRFLGRKFAYWSWARFMEWKYGVEIQWGNVPAFSAVSGTAKSIKPAASL
ncbi:uncharacterized protein CTHT_0051280 [Thermochaetoides thermophila DSM 1495]|uniref:Uncharacterized protein n=1 Tax=Chaetomium thermophilum (strain DSM 1495 / CBS 144.50 / IMI 039719) TaxID=759272 RepID=G0SDC4_CHATD|nr:hypothetical protein CTHT_0051280 [Thermochaetoides thermophila DSM 1495]EGS18525.1 hypothetical protein CTHT_0051280 [Thermochaetoides thermophila DSM 1495]